MNLYGALAITCAIIMFTLGNFVFYQDRKNNLNSVFALACVMASATAFSEFMYRQAGTVQLAEFWAKLCGIWPLMVSLLLHFFILYTGRGASMRKPYLPVLIHGPAAFFTLIFFFTSNLSQKLVLTPSGYVRNVYMNHGWEAAIGIWSVLVSLAILVIAAQYHGRTKGTARKTSGYLLATAVMAFVVPPLTEGLLPHMGIVIETEAPTLLSAVIAVLVTSAIARHGLFITDQRTIVQKIFEALPGFILLTNGRGTIMKANPYLAEKLGYSPGELENSSIDVLFRGYENVEMRLFNLLHTEGRIRNEECRFVTRSGSQVDVLLSGELLTGGKNDTAGYVFAAADIREQKELSLKLSSAMLQLGDSYDRLKALDEMKNNFVSMVSHELRTPLTSIKGFISLLQKGDIGSSPESRGEVYTLLAKNSERLLTLVNDLLDMSRIEKGSFSMAMEKTDLSVIVRETLDESRSLAEQKSIELIFHAPAGGAALTADPERIKQVVLNVIGNAVKFSPEKSGIEVSLEILDAKASQKFTGPGFNAAAPGYALLRITDHGPGMTPETAARVFDRFFQAGSQGTRKRQGAGLGLTIAKEIVEAHKGLIRARSEGPGKGSEIIIMLPVRQ